VLEGHTSWVNGINVSPNGRRAVSASWDKTLRVWDIETGICVAVASVSAPLAAVAFAANDQVFAGTETGQVLLFNIREPKM
jgi:WD40 repeat protein